MQNITVAPNRVPQVSNMQFKVFQNNKQALYTINSDGS